jgi:hypothetical protein
MKRTPLKRKTALRTKARETPVKRPKTKAKRKKVPNVTKLKKLLWQECRRITLNRYPDPKCFTCERAGIEGGNRQLGHFIPSSVCSVEMRYSLDNLRWQCYHCNINLSGNWPAYEKNLIREKGADFPDLLKKLNEATKGRQYDILWYQNKLEEYKAL